MCEDDSGPALLFDHIPRDVFVEKIQDEELISVLYDDPEVIRNTKKIKYAEQIIITDINNSLLVDRVKFMLDELSEAKWKSRIYTLERRKDYDLHIAEVLNLYLMAVRDFQSYAIRNADYIARIKAEFNAFIKMVNESFISLSDEYGCTVIKIREDFSNPALPAIVV